MGDAVRWSWALRLLLAEIREDPGAAELVADEVGECAGCWQAVAHHAIRLAAHGWFNAGDHDTLIELLCNGIAYNLDRLEGLDQEAEGSR